MNGQGAMYACPPFQEWLASRIEPPESWATTALVKLPELSQPSADTFETLKASIDLADVALVHDPTHGVVLRTGSRSTSLGERIYARGFSITGDAGDHRVVKIGVSGLLADASSARLLQLALVAHLRGQPIEEGRLTDFLRYAAWQRSLSSDRRAALPVAESTERLSFERPTQACQGSWVHGKLAGPETDALHIFCRERRLPVDAVLLSAWGLALRSVGVAGGLPIWVAFDGRGGEVPTNIIGHLTSYRAWNVPAGSDAELVANAAEWIESARRDRLAWSPAMTPLSLPRFSYASVPGELIFDVPGGTAVLSSPTPAPFASGMMLASSGGADTIDLRLWYDTGSFAAADATELVSFVGRLVATLPHSVGSRQRTRGARATESITAAGGGSAYRSLFDRVVDQATRNPDAVAVSNGDDSVTYRELVAAARAVARQVNAHRVGLDDCVGILLPQGPAFVAVLLGINSAGAAYVPLDYSLPAARIETMLRTAGVRMVVGDADARALIPLDVNIIEPLPMEQVKETADIRRADDPDGLAYVLFTSGSTGTPKGVLVTRGGLDNYLNWAVGHYPLARGAAVVTHSPPIFDLAITSLLAPLVAGLQVRVAPPNQGLDGLVATLRSVRDVSLLKLTPTHLAALDQLLGPQCEVRVYAAVVGGEDLATDVAAQWIEHHPECKVFNEYGPTETVVGCTVSSFESDDVSWPTVAIGHQVAGTVATVRDPELRPLELGVTGELFIGGRTVARGYARDPRRTAERFLPDPAGLPGARMYRSGDLAVATASRGLRYLGRADRQLKIRGFRIEPAEIEHRLRNLPAIREAVVRSAPASGDDAILVAYVVGDGPGNVDTTAIRAALRTYLPDYLLPDVVIGLDELPTTPNGKLDEDRLPDYRTTISRSTFGNRSDTEMLVQVTWQEVLGTVVTDLDGRFFELGGTSFSLVKVVARLSSATGIELAITELFERPTVRGMAELIDEKRDGKEDPAAQPSVGNDRLGAMQRIRLARGGIR